MSVVQKRVRNGTQRWVVRYRDPFGRQRSKVFERKADAEKYLVDTESAKHRGDYVDPRRAAVTFGEFAEIWLAAQAHLKPSTRDRYASLLRTHVLPHWRERRLNGIGHAEVQTWVSGLTERRSASVAVKSHRVLSLVLALAVRDGRLQRNPAEKVGLPREVPKDRVYLTHDQVEALASAAGEQRLLILFLAYTGVRFGEMAALRKRRLDLQHGRVEVAESVSAVNGHLVWGTPKSHTRRWVTVPPFVLDQLAGHVRWKGADELVFTSPTGTVLRASNFRRDVWNPACTAAGIHGAVPHGLRHTAASLAIAAGADVKVVQRMLGHKSATMTLDLYGHLFDDRLDEVAARLDAAARAARNTANTEPGQVINLDAHRPPRPVTLDP